SEFDVMSTAASGMEAQRMALEVAARNVAAAQVDGRFARLVPRFAVESEAGATQVRFVGTRALPGSHVEAITEMVGVLDAQRAYEANASVFELVKGLAERTIEAGRT
ncbi:MAG: flagellar basal body rod protein FlgC, partial [Candidatus Dormibacteria bacterium]